MINQFTIIKVLLSIAMAYSFAYAKKNDCPELQGCLCVKSLAQIQCTNVMEIPKYPAYIETVELVDNAITELKHEDFNHNKLVKLSLGDNKISAIDENAFKDLTELKHLNLSNNKLRQLGDDIFKYNKKLKQLDVSDNQDLSFSLAALPTTMENLNLINTNSMMTYNTMQTFVHLRSYHGNFCLNGNCSRWINMDVKIYSDEDAEINQSTTEKGQSIAKEPPQVNETNCKIGCWQAIMSCLGLIVLLICVFFASWKIYNCRKDPSIKYGAIRQQQQSQHQ